MSHAWSACKHGLTIIGIELLEMSTGELALAPMVQRNILLTNMSYGILCAVSINTIDTTLWQHYLLECADACEAYARSRTPKTLIHGNAAMVSMSENRQIALRYKITRKTEYIEATGCLVWPFTRGANGYGRIRIGERLCLAHRISYQLFKGNIPAGLCVCHSCDNPSCVNPEHLWLGTRRQNTYDAVAKGRLASKRNGTWRGGGFVKGHCLSKGIRRVQKLTDENVLVIRHSTEKTSILAERFKVERTTIQRIRAGKSKQLVISPIIQN